MPRVALVTNWDWVHVQLTLPLARGLRARGHGVTLISPAGDFTHRLKGEGFDHVDWHLDRRGMNPMAEVAAIRGLAQIYRAIDPDLVHHFTIKPNVYGGFAARRAGVPRVVCSFAGLGFAFSNDSRARMLRIGLIPLMRRALRDSWVIFENESDLETLTGRGVVDPNRTRVIAGSIDIDRFRPSVRTTDVPTFLMAGRLIRDKGLSELVEATERLRSEGVAVRVVVAGDIDPGNPASATESEIATWGASGAVEFVGRVSDIPELLAQADAAVLPSYYGEGAPRFLMEAAAAGLPSIAGDIAGCRAVVVDGRTGYLVPPRNVDALAAAMKRLALDPTTRSELGAQARELARRRFDEEEVVGEYVSLYEAAGLSDPKARPLR